MATRALAPDPIFRDAVLRLVASRKRPAWRGLAVHILKAKRSHYCADLEHLARGRDAYRATGKPTAEDEPSFLTRAGKHWRT